MDKEISVVIAVRNEEHYITRCLDSMINQDFPKEKYEILVVDGMSQDKTLEIVKNYQERFPELVRALSNPGKTQSRGRNIGISESKGKIVAYIDGHAYADKKWLHTLAEVLENSPRDVAGIGSIHLPPPDDTFSGKLIAHVQMSLLGGAGTSFRQKPTSRPVNTAPFVAYRKEVLEMVGLYDESLDKSEDVDLNWRIHKKGFKIIVSPNATTYYYRKYNCFSSLFRHLFGYGLWRAKFIKKHPTAIRMNTIAPPTIIAGILFLSVLSFFHPVISTLLSLTLIAYGISIFLNSVKLCIAHRDIKYLIAPIIYFLHHIGFGTGFLVGLLPLAVRSASKQLQKVAVIDRCIGDSWYSWQLCKEMSALIGEDKKLFFYVQKECAVKGQPGYTQLKKVWSPYLYPVQLLKHLIKDKPEIVHLQYEFSTFGSLLGSFLVLFLLMLVRALRMKVIVTLHGPIFRLALAKEALSYLRPRNSIIPANLLIAYMIYTYRLIGKLADKVVVHNSFFNRIVVEDYKISECKVSVIPHGVSSMDEVCKNTLARSNLIDKKFILYFGVISPRKGLEYLIEAYKQVETVCPDCVLMIAGAEPSYYKGYTDSLKSLVAKTDKIIFTGFVPDEELYTLFSKAEIVVLPYPISVSASGPLSLAIQFRKPIIATKTEFFNDVLSDGYDAVLAEPANSYDLAHKIIQIIKDKNLSSRLSKNIKFKADEYSYEKIANLTLDLYTNLTN